MTIPLEHQINVTAEERDYIFSWRRESLLIVFEVKDYPWIMFNDFTLSRKERFRLLDLINKMQKEALIFFSSIPPSNYLKPEEQIRYSLKTEEGVEVQSDSLDLKLFRYFFSRTLSLTIDSRRYYCFNLC